MTLIFGANLQDCVYLACDTRLTTELPSGLVKCEDDFLKAHTFSQNMHCVAAGDANFASFLLNKIESSPLKNATYDIFERGIESLLKEEIGFYQGIQKCPTVAFIFAGVDPSKRKKIEMEKLMEYTRIMQEAGLGPVSQRIRKDFVQSIAKKAIRGEKGGGLEAENIPLTGLFGLKIITSEGEVKITKEETVWGEYLLYGEKGLHKDNVPQEYFIDLDLRSLSTDVKTIEDLIRRDTLTIASLFEEDLIPLYDLRKVGGVFFVMHVTEKGNAYAAGDIAKKDSDGKIKYISRITHKDGKMCTVIGDEIVPMRHIINFYSDKKESMALI